MVGRLLRRWRLLLGVVLILVVFGVGWWVGRRDQREFADLPEPPWVVRVTSVVSGAMPYGGVDIRDRQTIQFLDTLFPDYRHVVQAGPPAAPAGDHHVLEFTLERVGYAKQLVVWSEGDVEYWSGGREKRRVQGSFRGMLEWLPARRAIELNRRPQTADDVGREIMTTRRDEFLRIVIDNARHQVRDLRFWAVRDLLTLIESAAPRTEHRAGGHPVYQPLDGFVNGPFPAGHPHIDEIRAVSLQSLEGDVVRDASTILAYTADEATIDELAKRLESTDNWRTAGDLIICLQACLGHPGFQKGGMCGNSSPEEFRRFAESEAQRTQEATTELLKWYGDWKGLPGERRSAAVVSVWRTELSRIPEDYESVYFSAQMSRYQNLLRRGSALLPAVEAEQAQSTDLTLRGNTEFCKAFWTGKCDAALVTELLGGARHQQVIACDIIAATLDPSWKDQLAELLREPKPLPENLVEWGRTVDKAVETAVMCHGVEALPLLRELQPRGFDSIRYAVQHYEVPTGEW